MLPDVVPDVRRRVAKRDLQSGNGEAPIVSVSGAASARGIHSLTRLLTHAWSTAGVRRSESSRAHRWRYSNQRGPDQPRTGSTACRGVSTTIFASGCVTSVDRPCVARAWNYTADGKLRSGASHAEPLIPTCLRRTSSAPSISSTCSTESRQRYAVLTWVLMGARSKLTATAPSAMMKTFGELVFCSQCYLPRRYVGPAGSQPRGFDGFAIRAWADRSSFPRKCSTGRMRGPSGCLAAATK